MNPRAAPGNVAPRVLGVTSIAAGIALNPLLVARLVFGHPMGGPFAMHAILWVAGVLLVVLGVLVLRRRITVKPVVARVLMSACVAIATVYLTVAADRVLGKIRGPTRAGVAMPPHWDVTFETSECEFVVRANSLGFRGGECPIAKGSRYRIVAIGDSFTLGWGVNIEDAWTTVVQSALARDASNVEVLNLGLGGAEPEGYERIAQSGIPLLKPDLVIVGVLQGDDLFQTIYRLNQGNTPPVVVAPRTETSLLGSCIRFVRVQLLPHILRPPVKSTIAEKWKEAAESIHAKLTPEQKSRLDGLDGSIRADFFDGTLNPYVLQSSLLFPDYYSRYDDPSTPEAQKGIQSLADSLTAIRKIAAEHGARMVVASIPYRAYVSRQDLVHLRKLGFSVPDSLAASDGADAAVRQAALKAGVECFEFNAPVRAACASKDLYYPLDGHFNKAGNALFAELMTSALRDYMSRRSPASRTGR